MRVEQLVLFFGFFLSYEELDIGKCI